MTVIFHNHFFILYVHLTPPIDESNSMFLLLVGVYSIISIQLYSISFHMYAQVRWAQAEVQLIDGGRALGVLSSAIESAEQVAKQGEGQGGSGGGNSGSNAATAPIASNAPGGDSANSKKDSEVKDSGVASENNDETDVAVSSTAAADNAPLSDETNTGPQSTLTQDSPYSVWHGEEHAAKLQLSRKHSSRRGRGGTSTTSAVNLAGAPFVPLLCWQAARISMLRADTHRSKLTEARLLSRPVPMGSVNSLKSAWLAAKGYLEKGLQCPFPTNNNANTAISSTGDGGSGIGPDNHLQVLLAWQLAALAAQGAPPGVSNGNSTGSSSGSGSSSSSSSSSSTSSKGGGRSASVDFEVDGRRSASHFAFAKSALLAAAAASAAASHGSASSRALGSTSLSAAPAMSGGAAAAVRAARSNHSNNNNSFSNNSNNSNGSSSRLSPRLAQSQVSPLTLLTTPERCFQLVLALARADAQAGRRCAAASATRASLRRGCSHLWARHMLMTLALQHAVDKASDEDSSFGADGAAVANMFEDDTDALAAAEAAAKVCDGGIKSMSLLFVVVICGNCCLLIA